MAGPDPDDFVIERAGFTGVEIGWLHTVREIPGFLAVGVIVVIMFIREQVLATIALMLLGVATALTGFFPSLGGLLILTFLSSLGFHYYETVNQSLQLQWIDKARAPQVLGWLVAVGSAASLIAYGVLVLTWKAFDLSYNFVYLTAGGITLALAVFAFFAWPQFESPHPQHKALVLRRRYWLYYLLQFMAGARRQIFVVFAAFMMVERFGLRVDQLTALFLQAQDPSIPHSQRGRRKISGVFCPPDRVGPFPRAERPRDAAPAPPSGSGGFAP